jgi:hypothetical protein
MNMKRRFFLTLLVIMFFATSSSVYGNMTTVIETAKTAYPINTDKVRMVSEKVKIKVSRKDIYPSVSVTCEFVFENISDEAITTKVGFPGREVAVGDATFGDYYGLRNFKASINGRTVPVDKKEEVLKEDGYENGKHVPRTVRYWYTWEGVFTPMRG